MRKMINHFKKEVEKVLKSNNKAEIKKLKEQLINFINGNFKFKNYHLELECAVHQEDTNSSNYRNGKK
jgi:DNA-binding ferritin-like protein